MTPSSPTFATPDHLQPLLEREEYGPAYALLGGTQHTAMGGKDFFREIAPLLPNLPKAVLDCLLSFGDEKSILPFDFLWHYAQRFPQEKLCILGTSQSTQNLIKLMPLGIFARSLLRYNMKLNSFRDLSFPLGPFTFPATPKFANTAAQNGYDLIEGKTLFQAGFAHLSRLLEARADTQDLKDASQTLCTLLDLDTPGAGSFDFLINTKITSPQEEAAYAYLLKHTYSQISSMEQLLQSFSRLDSRLLEKHLRADPDLQHALKTEAVDENNPDALRKICEVAPLSKEDQLSFGYKIVLHAALRHQNAIASSAWSASSSTPSPSHYSMKVKKLTSMLNYLLKEQGLAETITHQNGKMLSIVLKNFYARIGTIQLLARHADLEGLEISEPDSPWPASVFEMRAYLAWKGARFQGSDNNTALVQAAQDAATNQKDDFYAALVPLLGNAEGSERQRVAQNFSEQSETFFAANPYGCLLSEDDKSYIAQQALAHISCRHRPAPRP